jgi:MiaB/RimO family radical SAM methylthiotransferase
MEYKIFGCKVNKYYTDKWLNSKQLKWQTGIFIASCVVTDNAKRKWLKFVKTTAKDLKEWDKIFISWCWAFKDWKAQDDFFDLYPEIEYLREKIKILDEDPEKYWNPAPFKAEWIRKEQINLKKIPKWIYTKKFILIQWWCDSFCSFCLTVKKRWRHYSRSKEDILAEILEFEQNWWKEVVLTWINLSAWGLDSTNDIWKSRFAELIKYILENTKIPRIRISSMWPEFITDEVLKLLENSRIYPHFHYSVQSASSNVLKSMSRHYNWKYMKDLLLRTRKIKRDDWIQISIWADIIVWFPWETEENFKETLDLIKECNITKVHAFPFSWHELWEDVPAWKFPNQIDWKIKKNRMWEIMNLSDQIRENFIDNNIWKELEVLIEVVKTDEKTWNTKWKWWTQNYIEADYSNFEIISGEIKRNEIVKWKLIK